MLLGFKADFVEPIQAGTKEFTLRKRTTGRQKHPPKIGEQLHMYTGLRTKWCTVISKNHKLQYTQNVRLRLSDNWAGKKGLPGLFIEIQVDGRHLSIDEIPQFTKRDGFASPRAFAEYWLGKKNRAAAFLVMYGWKGEKY